jgi:maltose alpha-D-glucosyltransferase/alpha-amylase
VLDWAELPAPVAANTTILPSADLPSASSIPPALFYFEIGYGDNLSDTYQVPLAFSAGADAESLSAQHPESVLAMMPSPAGSGVLHDATVREDLRQGLLTLIERNATVALTTTRVAALEIAASLAASANGNTASEAITNGEAVEVLHHPEWATTNAASAGEVHLRPHEAFPRLENDPHASEVPPDAVVNESAPAAPHSLAGLPVAPAPISAQPGEAATPPRTSATASFAQRRQPRESPSAGDPVPASGRLDARSSSAFARSRDAHRLPASIGSAEQSNTSVIYGKELILKLFRRLQPGENPDVEIGRFLTEVAHFRRIAPFLGEITITPARGDKTTVAMLQGLVANHGDGWQWFLNQLSGFFESVASLPPPMELPATGFIDQRESPPEALKYAGTALEAAALLGRRTAEMHLALATHTDDPAFAAEPFTAVDQSRDARRIEDQITSTLDALKGKLPALVDMVADDAALLLSRRRELIARAHAIESGPAAGKRIRIHGDYHLGQTLRTGTDPESGDFVLLDFEGEPARPLIERRQKQSPLKDVAGMVRSFSYAAHSGINHFLPEGSSETAREPLGAWAMLWQNSVSSEFLRAYRATIAGNFDLLPPPEQAQTLYTAYLLEKALYELLYELNNRPTWLRIPISGILSM